MISRMNYIQQTRQYKSLLIRTPDEVLSECFFFFLQRAILLMARCNNNNKKNNNK